MAARPGIPAVLNPSIFGFFTRLPANLALRLLPKRVPAIRPSPFFWPARKKLISIAPEAALRDRITDFCEINGINRAPLEFFVDRSETRLPLFLAERTKLDLALIDGCHGWPSVFVDFCYLNAMLKKDGLMIVDDVQLHSVGELAAC